MNRWRKPVPVNSSILVMLFLLYAITTSPIKHGAVSRFTLSGTLILVLAVVNQVIGMLHNRDKKADGPVYIAFAGILLLIGFSVCSVPVIFK